MYDKAGRIQDLHQFATITPAGINYLLVIGIDAYQHCPRLYNCVKDAEAFIQLLTERYRFEAQHIYTVFNEKATRGNMYRAFREMAQRVTPQDNLLIYFSGHGEYDNIFKEGYWIPVEAQAGNYDQYIPNSEIRTFLTAINSHHTFLMSDSCFAGALFAKGLDKNIEKRYENDPSRWGLTAGRNEVVSDGKPGDNSPFAESLLYRLRQNTGAMGVQELCAYVTEYVQAKTNQTPIGEPLRVEGHKNGQFVFHLKKDETRDWTAAQEANTLAAYENFLLVYPEGRHTEEARTIVAAMRDDAAWHDAQTSNTITSYDRYLQQYRQGRYRRMAIDAQKAIEEADAWQRAAQRNTISAYRDFQFNYSESKYYNEAETRIQQLQEKSEPAQPFVQPLQRVPKPKKSTPKKVLTTPENPAFSYASVSEQYRNNKPLFISNIRILIGEGDLEKALAELTSFLQSEKTYKAYYNYAVKAQSLLQRTKEDETFGTISFDNARLNYNQITHQILTILEDLEKNKKNLKSRTPYIAIVGGVLLLLLLLIWQPWQANINPNPAGKKQDSTESVETKAYEATRQELNIKTLNAFLQKYPNGAHAADVMKEVYKMEVQVNSALKDAQAYLNGESYRDAITELEAVVKLESDNKFIAYALDALNKKEYEKAKKMIVDGIQLQKPKLIPPASPLGG